MSDRGTAVVTGASSGIGEATARQLAAQGFDVVIGARRVDRLAPLASAIGGRYHALDVTDEDSVAAFCSFVGDVRVLVNNAGGALGMDPITSADSDKWRAMWESNVMGLMRMTRALLPRLIDSGNGHVVNVGSVAAFEPYAGGAGYNAAKHAARAVSDVLRIELNGRPVRVTEVDPGLVETEFSVVRFGGDTARAASVYDGLTPLSADDIADVITFAVTRPPHVDIDQVVVRPRAQARVWLVHRDDQAPR
jgi:NADP-dependent 3-hydroxy acid dehydrogenase YdfG